MDPIRAKFERGEHMTAEDAVALRILEREYFSGVQQDGEKPMKLPKPRRKRARYTNPNTRRTVE